MIDVDGSPSYVYGAHPAGPAAFMLSPSDPTLPGQHEISAHQERLSRHPSRPLPLQPLTVDELRALPVHDYHKINHQIHLSQVPRGDLDAISLPLIEVTSQLMLDRHHAEQKIEQLNGVKGNILSGSPEARKYHMQAAGAQLGLHQLVAPLKAAHQAADNTGHLNVKKLLKDQLERVIPEPYSIRGEPSNHIGHQWYKQIVGQPTKYTRKSG